MYDSIGIKRLKCAFCHSSSLCIVFELRSLGNALGNVKGIRPAGELNICPVDSSSLMVFWSVSAKFFTQFNQKTQIWY